MRTATKSDFPNYTFNEDGTVINNETGAPLTARPSKKGFVFMLKNSDSKSKSVLQSEFLTELFPGNDTIEPFSDIDAANEVGITSEGAENEALNLDDFTLPGETTAAPEPVNEESHIAVQMPSTVYEGGEDGGEEVITTEAPVVSITKGKKGAKAKEAKAAKVIIKAKKPVKAPAKKKVDKEAPAPIVAGADIAAQNEPEAVDPIIDESPAKEAEPVNAAEAKKRKKPRQATLAEVSIMKRDLEKFTHVEQGLKYGISSSAVGLFKSGESRNNILPAPEGAVLSEDHMSLMLDGKVIETPRDDSRKNVIIIPKTRKIAGA